MTKKLVFEKLLCRFDMLCTYDTSTSAGLEIATDWLPMRLKMPCWRPVFESQSPTASHQ